MAFWDNVAFELDCVGMTNKALAEKVGITASNIGKGIRQGSSPSADTAVKIAKILGVSVEYLVEGEDIKQSDKTAEQKIRLSPKQKQLLEDFSKLSEVEQKAIIKLTETLLTQH